MTSFKNELYEKEIKYFEDGIKKNKTILLSNFGVQGLKNSQLKKAYIIDIVSTVADVSMEKVVDDFFDVLGKTYLYDSVMGQFTREEISHLIAEEREYIKCELGGKYSGVTDEGKNKAE